MCKISYEHFRKLWLEQTELYIKCTDDLIRGAYTLRSRLAELIKAPEKWIDPVNSKEHRYIEIISLKTKASPDNTQDLSESINEKGVLPVGLSIALDHNINSYPKTLFHMPVALRYADKELQFSLWNPELDEPEGKLNWTSDLDSFLSELLSQIEKYFTHDPYSGFEKKPQFGFTKH
jgi:hypothetical protein